MIVVTAQNFINLDYIKEFTALAKEMVEKTQKENGCISYNVFRDKENGELFCFMEKWESAECLQAHFTTEHFMRIVPEVGKISKKQMILNVYEEFI